METDKSEDILYWEISDFTGNKFSLMAEGAKIYGQKLTIKDIEKYTGKKAKVCPTTLNPHYIVQAKVVSNGVTYLDNRTGLRGTTYRCYIDKG